MEKWEKKCAFEKLIGRIDGLCTDVSELKKNVNDMNVKKFEDAKEKVNSELKILVDKVNEFVREEGNEIKTVDNDDCESESSDSTIEENRVRKQFVDSVVIKCEPSEKERQNGLIGMNFSN